MAPQNIYMHGASKFSISKSLIIVLPTLLVPKWYWQTFVNASIIYLVNKLRGPVVRNE